MRSGRVTTRIGRTLSIAAIALLCLGGAQKPPSALRLGLLVPHAGGLLVAVEGGLEARGTQAFAFGSTSLPAITLGERHPALADGGDGRPLVLIAGVPASLYAARAQGSVAPEQLPLAVSIGEPPPRELAASSCWGREGIHVTVRPLSGSARSSRWSASFYLGYDIEPSCSPEELAQ